MTNEQIDALLALEAKATPGPWEVHENPRYWCRLPNTETGDSNRDNNAALVTAARNNIRELAEEVKLLREALLCISCFGGNLPDERITTRTGPNDAAIRGEMIVEARRIARQALRNEATGGPTN